MLLTKYFTKWRDDFESRTEQDERISRRWVESPAPLAKAPVTPSTDSLREKSGAKKNKTL